MLMHKSNSCSVSVFSGALYIFSNVLRKSGVQTVAVHFGTRVVLSYMMTMLDEYLTSYQMHITQISHSPKLNYTILLLCLGLNI